ncbi:nuclear transport factor 2 family protein [Bradyrhizobium japonicum]|uniref:nuclear transport factor 2 family protein n=1 Tax=Bradyrhizobium japonicum TaxID=375 RepID=UPI001FCE23CE|nr:nuclear transport factor 2 family protein [Bradyrhizobium japonicum]
MSFDLMAAAVDWLDVYRAGDLETILGMDSEDAVVHCGCGGVKIITGREALRAYWGDRLRDYPASKLDNRNFSHDGTLIAYITATGVVSTFLWFDEIGKINSLRCGPSDQGAERRRFRAAIDAPTVSRPCEALWFASADRQAERDAPNRLVRLRPPLFEECDRHCRIPTVTNAPTPPSAALAGC